MLPIYFRVFSSLNWALSRYSICCKYWTLKLLHHNFKTSLFLSPLLGLSQVLQALQLCYTLTTCVVCADQYTQWCVIFLNQSSSNVFYFQFLEFMNNSARSNLVQREQQSIKEEYLWRTSLVRIPALQIIRGVNLGNLVKCFSFLIYI